MGYFKKNHKNNPIYLDVRKFQEVEKEEKEKIKVENIIFQSNNEIDLRNQKSDKTNEEEGIQLLEEFVISNQNNN